MSDRPDRPVAEALAAVGRGEELVSEELLPLVYDELRRLARARMARESPQTLQPTALVHEAYLRISGAARGASPRWDNRGHFFAAAAEAMRRILIERARRVSRLRHGGEFRFVELPTGGPAGWQPRAEELLALDEALERLAQRDEQMARIVELRFFAGLTQVEAAEALGCSERTVRRSWVAARAWLTRELRSDGDAEAVGEDGAGAEEGPS